MYERQGADDKSTKGEAEIRVGQSTWLANENRERGKWNQDKPGLPINERTAEEAGKKQEHCCDFNKSPKKQMGHPQNPIHMQFKRGTHQVKPNLPGRTHVQEGTFSSMDLTLGPGAWARRKN